MAKDDLKRRIEALNKRPLRNAPDPDAVATHHSVDERPAHTVYSTAALAATLCPAPILTFEETIEAHALDAPLGPGYCFIEKRAQHFDRDAPDIYTDFCALQATRMAALSSA